MLIQAVIFTLRWDLALMSVRPCCFEPELRGKGESALWSEPVRSHPVRFWPRVAAHRRTEKEKRPTGRPSPLQGLDPTGHEPMHGCPEPVPVCILCQAVDICPVFPAIVNEAEAVRDHHMTPAGRIRHFQLDFFRTGFRGDPDLLTIFQTERFSVGGVHRERTSPLAFIPGGVSHQRIGVHGYVPSRHEDQRKLRVHPERRLFIPRLDALKLVEQFRNL